VKLPSGIDCSVDAASIDLGKVDLDEADVVALIRVFFTTQPLKRNDLRLGLLEEIRGAIVKSDETTGQRWLVLNALRAVSLRKLRTHRRRA